MLFAFCAFDLTAQSTAKYSNEFLSIGVGARSFGMSHAIVAGIDDVNASYWNPSALTKMDDKIQLSYMHSNYFGGIGNYDYGSLGIQLDKNNAFAISFIRLGIDGIPNTLDLINNGRIDYDRIREFSAVDYAFVTSYAQESSIEGLSYGANAKLIHRKAGDFAKAWGFGIDASASYELDNGWKFGAIARDVTSTFNAWKYSFTESEKDVLAQTGNEIPRNSLEITLPKFILGAGKAFEFGKNVGLYSEIDLDMTTDGKRNVLLRTNVLSIDPHLGVELDYMKLIFLRMGVGNIQQVNNFVDELEWTVQPNFGVGLALDKFVLDYALTDVGDQSDVLYSHVFSLRFNLNSQSDN